MRVLTFDVETTHMTTPNGGSNPSPHFGNRLVSLGFKWLNSECTYLCFHHADREPHNNAFDIFKDALKLADVCIGQNIKFDLGWIRSCGWVYSGEIYDTMVAEYILSKSRRWPLGLASLADKYGVTKKEKDLVTPYLKEGKTFYDIPWEVVEEYGRADIIATEEVALKQLSAFGTTFEDLFDGKRINTYT
jgi:DNA polymerase I-like protein with 3'-5' exonuclease and polymerase domains|tara:strand:- start:2919 stop:3488 length:570 start_codon:yes stop_codon:yes gene_type:complete